MAESNSPKNLAFEVGARASAEGAAAAAERLMNKLRLLDFRCFEPMAAETAVSHMVFGPVTELTRLLNASVRLLRSLPPLVGVAETLDGEESVMIPDGAVVQSTLPTEGEALPRLDRYCEELDASLRNLRPRDISDADVQNFVVQCQRTLVVMKESLDMLRLARRQNSKWGLITAGEEARRKTQKGLRASVIMSMRLLAPGQAEALFPNDTSELQTALMVRAALMEFRRDVLALVEPSGVISDHDVGLLLRDVRVRLLQLFGERSYQDLRAPDRFQLQLFMTRVSEWLDKAWDNAAPARELMGELADYARGLQRVNHRTILIHHDLEVKQQVLAKLLQLQERPPTSSTECWRGLANALQDARRMEWRSDALDMLVKQELTLGALSVAEMQSRAGVLAAAVNAAAVS